MNKPSLTFKGKSTKVLGVNNSGLDFMKKIFYAFCFLFICSCWNAGKTITSEMVDDFVKTYQKESFMDFKNVFIHVRQYTFTSTIYILGKHEGNIPVYFVTYNELLNKITEIKYRGMEENKIPSYFSDDQIKFLIDKFRKTKFCLLGVDSLENVFINPFYANNPHFFLRKNKNVNLVSLSKTGDYVHYKGDWYINRSAITPTMRLSGLGK